MRWKRFFIGWVRGRRRFRYMDTIDYTPDPDVAQREGWWFAPAVRQGGGLCGQCGVKDCSRCLGDGNE